MEIYTMFLDGKNQYFQNDYTTERLLLNHTNTPGFLAPEGEFNPGPETRLDRSELLCNKV